MNAATSELATKNLIHITISRLGEVQNRDAHHLEQQNNVEKDDQRCGYPSRKVAQLAIGELTHHIETTREHHQRDHGNRLCADQRLWKEADRLGIRHTQPVPAPIC